VTVNNKKTKPEKKNLRSILQEEKKLVVKRNKLKDELESGEEFFATLFDYNPLEMIIVNKKGEIIRFNRAKRESGNRLPQPGDIMYRNYAAHHEIDMYNELKKCMETGKIAKFPKMKYKDKFLSVTISPFPGGAIIISDNVTEKTTAEQELRYTTTLLSEAERIAHIGSWEWDINTDRIVWSDEIFRIFGLEPSSIPVSYETVLDFIHPEDRNFFDKSVKDAFKGEKTFDTEYHIIKQTGRITIVHAIGEVIYDESGKPVMMIGVVQDINRRRNLEKDLRIERMELKEALRKQQLLTDIAARFQSVISFESVFDEICHLIKERIVVNDVGLFNFKRDNAQWKRINAEPGSPVKTSFPTINAFMPFYKRFERMKPLRSSGLRNLTKPERKFLERRNIGSFLAFPITISQAFTGYIVYSCSRKITWNKDLYNMMKTITTFIFEAWQKDYFYHQRIKAENERAEAVQMAEKSMRLATIGILTAGIAHEINQPLSALKILANSMILRGEKEIKKENLMQSFEFISDQASRINQIIHQMRSLARDDSDVRDREFLITDTLDIIKDSLYKHNGNKTATALYLGISRKVLYKYLRNIENF